MKKYFILSAKLFFLSFLFSSCSKSDDSGSPSGSSDDPFIFPISQLPWEDTLDISRTYSFGNPDSAGRFTGVENFNGQKFLSGKTYRFDISFTVIKDQFSNYVDYAGKMTDTLSTHQRMVLYSKIDTLYLRR